MTPQENNNGYILLARQILDSEIWAKPPQWLKIWLYILENVRYRPTAGCRRGEGWFNLHDVARDCHASYSTVEHCLRWLKSAKQIATRKATRGMWIFALHYEEYQNPDFYKSDTKSDTRSETLLEHLQFQSDTIKEEGKKVRREEVVPSFQNESQQLAIELSTHIRNTNPAYAAKHTRDDPALVGKWAAELDKLIRIDKATEEQIRFVITWLFTSEDRDALFWRKNIQSGATLRKQWQRLVGSVKFAADHQKNNGYLFIS